MGTYDIRTHIGRRREKSRGHHFDAWCKGRTRTCGDALIERVWEGLSASGPRAGLYQPHQHSIGLRGNRDQLQCGSSCLEGRLLAWYAAKTNSDMVAEENLSRLGFQAFLPKCMVKLQRKRGGFELVVRPYFSGYIFVRFDPFVKMWRVGTRGVKELLMMGGQPSPVPDEVMRLLLSMCNGSGIVEQSMIDVKLVTLIPLGATVDIGLNPLSTLRGKVTLSAHDRVTILTSIFGRQTEVTVAPSQVEVVV